MDNARKKSVLTVKKARKILGTTGEGLSDNAIKRLVQQVDTLTEVVIAQYKDSKKHSSIDISSNSLDTCK